VDSKHSSARNGSAGTGVRWETGALGEGGTMRMGVRCGTGALGQCGQACGAERNRPMDSYPTDARRLRFTILPQFKKNQLVYLS
jgi:hypothetical protein